MIYIPTKEELEELGFEILRYPRFNKYIHDCDLVIEITKNKRVDFSIIDTEVYPQSLDDIRTLIRLLTPQ